MNDKKLLAILGSPHTAGTTATMLNHAIYAAEKSGYKITKIDLYSKQIAYCKGCRSCIKTRKCVLQDDMSEICSLLQECDMVILAAPTYWANVPAPVKNLFDRALGIAMDDTAGFPKPRLQGKSYMMLTACNTPFPFSWIARQSSGALHNMNEFFKTAGMKCIGKFTCANVINRSELPRSLINKIERSFK